MTETIDKELMLVSNDLDWAEPNRCTLRTPFCSTREQFQGNRNMYLNFRDVAQLDSILGRGGRMRRDVEFEIAFSKDGVPGFKPNMSHSFSIFVSTGTSTIWSIP
jgi:hypothetical protein